MATGIKLRPTTKPHPLQSVVVETARRVGVLDVPKLANELSGCTTFLGRRAAGANKAYRIVAEDVLGYMHGQGLLIHRLDGWYELNEASLEVPTS